ncbi:hypothetical protein HOLleu_37952 [Holothuria leucospilota]|uniref:EF-hand domain-containing protein n=1 Tax=Holothuria leucospilota TaxID=206669 RepID=A0A9Q0YPP6_HOLLE|nr:hypothetical protein HOLleu_37952 [Holothuria leucospilota]
MYSEVKMDSILPDLDCHEEMDISTNQNYQQYMEVKVNTKLPLILRPEEDKSGQKQTWNKQAKRPRLHPNFNKVNNRDMGSLQQAPEKLSPMPYQPQLFRSSTSLKMVPLKKFHRAVESMNQQLPTQVTKSRLISFHARNFPYQGDSTLKVCEQESFEPYHERGYEEEDGSKSHKRKKHSGKHETEYRDLHVGGQHSRLVERDDGSCSKVCMKYGSIKQRDSEESPPTTAPSLREIHHSNPAVHPGLTSNQSVALKSLSLEEMSIKRNLIKSKNIHKKKEHQLFPFSNKADAIVNEKRRIPHLLPEYQRKPKKKYPHQMKKSVAPKDAIKEEKETVGDRHRHLYHNESKRESKRFVRDRRKDSDMNWKKHKDNQVETVEIQKNEITNQTQLMQDEVVEPLDNVDTLEEEEKCFEEEPEMERSLSSRDSKTSIPEESQKQTFTVPSSPSLLKLSDLVMYLTGERFEYLKEKFHKLDGDKDGHLKFCELETEIPTNLNHMQKIFIKEVYDVISSSTFFGLAEFCTVTLICEQLLQLPDIPTKSIDNLISSQSLQDEIATFMMEFSKVDVDRTSAISMDLLKSVLEASLSDIRSDTAWWEDVLRDIHRTNKQSINKVEFLCLIPYFLNLRV